MTSAVRDLMTRTVVAAHEDTPFKELVALMHESCVSALPVVDAQGAIVGVVSEADLLLREDLEIFAPRFFERRGRRIERDKATALRACDLMTSPAITVGLDATATDVAHAMHEHHVKRVFVVDEGGRILGVVSRVDLLKAFLRTDRDIADEVERVLTDELFVPVGAVTATVDDGVVSLVGQVDRRTLAPHIATRMRAIEGVVGIEDHLTWEFDDTTPAGYGVGWIGF